MRNNYTLLGRQSPSRAFLITSIVLIVTISSLVVLYSLPSTPAVLAPFVNKVQDYWKVKTGTAVTEYDEEGYDGVWDVVNEDTPSGGSGGIEELVVPGREAAKGGLKDIGRKASFRTNLRDDKYYLMSWGGSAGWTNVFFTQIKNIHLAHLSSRIPIILPTYPNSQHLTQSAAPILMSDIFDLPRLSRHLNLPLIEMEDLKGPSIARRSFGFNGEDDGFEAVLGEMSAEEEVQGDWENFGCWSLSQTSQNNTRGDFGCDAGRIRLKFTPLAQSVLMPEHPSPYGFTAMTHLSEVFTPNSPNTPIINQSEISQQEAWHPGWEAPTEVPEDRISCIDSYLFFNLPYDGYEGGQWMDRTNATWNTWNEVGRYTYWREDVQHLADNYLRDAFGISKGEDVPDYISVHIRRTDLLWACYNDGGELQHDCLSPALFRHKANEIRTRLSEEKRVKVGEHIVVTTDEEDPEYLAELKAQGMKVIDHAKAGTIEKYGAWWPTVLDAVFLSGARGFVGTQGSTMSEVAIRRIEDWHQGLAVQISPWDRLPVDSEN